MRSSFVWLAGPIHEAAPPAALRAIAQRLIAAHPEIPARLLVGADRISGNPKLNNLVKGWSAASYP